MKNILLLIYSAFLILFPMCRDSFSQNPLVKQWDKRFGGNSNDELHSFQQTSDGGYMLGGASYSDLSGDKSQNHWGTNLTNDYWIVKTDSLGIKQWDKDFGGTDVDNLFSVQQTADGGYILGGFSLSDSSGNKTQSTQGFADYWIAKTNSLGIIQWDKDFGGTNIDQLYSVHQTADGGYILGGKSYSDSSGDKTQHTRGLADYWIIKTDSLGNKQWDKAFGGTNDDLLYSVLQTADGGYILGGYSNSGIGGDKTQANWAFYDYWIIKTDSLGGKQWDKDFGGTNVDQLYSLQQTSDGGYILGGWSLSQISGNKTQNTQGGSGDDDYWIVKTDSMGTMQWDKDFGGTSDEDDFGTISQTADGGYLLAGASYSGISGDKTENNLAPEQTWVVKTDLLGVKQWDKTLRTNASLHDESGYAIQATDGCYIMGNFTNGGAAGDKTQPNWGSTLDYWIIKFCDTTLTTNSSGLTLNKDEGMLISPNPFSDEISIAFQNHPETSGIKQATISIKNILGQIVFSKPIPPPTPALTTKLDLSFLSKGIYLLEITIDGVPIAMGRTVKKIVKE